MSKKPRILVVGSFVMDVIATTERIPRSAQTVYGRSFHMAPGGKGANQALQCARLGAEVTMMGCVGDDMFAEVLLKTPREAGVDVSHVVQRRGVHSGVGHVTLKVTNHTAQNRIVVIPGANQTLTLEEVAWIRDEIASYDIVLLQLEVPIEINRAVAHWAKDAGIPVMLNPAPATELDDELLSLVTYLTPNEQEASVETGLPLRSGENGPCKDDLQEIAAALRKKGVKHTIVTLGSAGSAVAPNIFRKTALCACAEMGSISANPVISPRNRHSSQFRSIIFTPFIILQFIISHPIPFFQSQNMK